MKLITFSILCFFSIGINQVCFAQSQTNIDSLLLVLKTAGEDTNRVIVLTQLSNGYCFTGEYDLARKYSHEALILSEKIGYVNGKVKAYLNTGVPYFYEDNYVKALENYYAALAICEKTNYKRGMATCYNNIGLVYSYQRKYSEAVKMHQAALKYQQEIFDTSGMGHTYNDLGIIYEDQGNYTEAIKSYLGLLKVGEALGNKRSVADAHFNMGSVYCNQGNWRDGLNNFSFALKVYLEMGYKQGVALCYLAMGGAYQAIDSLELAIKFTRQANGLFEVIGNRMNATQAKMQMAEINTDLGNNAQAISDFSTVLKLFEERSDTVNISIAYKGIGEVYLKTGQFDEALKNFNTGLEMAKAVNYKSNIVYLYGAIARAYEKKNDFKSAYLNHKLYFALNDSLLNETKSEQIAEMKTRYETEKKDNEITLLNKDNKIQDVEIKKQKLLKNFFIGGLGLVIVMMLLSYRTYRIRQSLRLQDIRNKIAGDLHDDIGSTLNSISIYSEVARRKDVQQDEALEMIGDASRKIIDAMSDIVWSVNPDNDSFAKIIFRMKSLAYNLFRAKQIEFTFHADETLNDKKLSLEVRRNFYLIFKEAVNNLVKYSNAMRSAITLTNENGYIKLSIKDDGVGFDTSAEIIGNGLKNMKRRADEMNAQFKIESSKGNGTQVDLTLKV